MAEESFTSIILNLYRNWQNLNAVHEVRNILLVLGYWVSDPVEHKKKRPISYWIGRSFAWAAMFVGCVVFPINAFVNFKTDIINSIENMGFTFLTSIITSHIVTFAYRGRLFDELMAILIEMEDLACLQFERPDSIISETKWMTNLVLGYYAFLSVVMIPFAGIVIPVTSFIQRDFLIKIWYPLDWMKSPLFEITVVSWMWPVTFGIYLMILCNSFFMALMVEVIKHFRLLNHNLSQIGREASIGRGLIDQGDAPRSLPIQVTQKIHATQRRRITHSLALQITEGKDNSDNSYVFPSRAWEIGLLSNLRNSSAKKAKLDKYMESRLSICVQHQEAISRFIEKIEDAFGLILLLQFTCCVLPIIIGMILTNQMEKIDIKIFIYGFLIAGCLFDQAIFSWLADQVAEESEGARDAVFDCDWFEATDGFKRSMRIIMSRSNQPLVIKVAGFVPLNMESLFGVLKLTYSYYMSLTTMV